MKKINIEYIKKLTLLIVTIILFLIIFELAMRLIFAGSLKLNCEIMKPDENVIKDNFIGWNSPKSFNGCFIDIDRNKLIHYKTNKEGAKGNEEINQTKEKKRILLIGDSFLQNAKVDDEYSLNKILSNYLLTNDQKCDEFDKLKTYAFMQLRVGYTDCLRPILKSCYPLWSEITITNIINYIQKIDLFWKPGLKFHNKEFYNLSTIISATNELKFTLICGANWIYANN